MDGGTPRPLTSSLIFDKHIGLRSISSFSSAFPPLTFSGSVWGLPQSGFLTVLQHFASKQRLVRSPLFSEIPFPPLFSPTPVPFFLSFSTFVFHLPFQLNTHEIGVTSYLLGILLHIRSTVEYYYRSCKVSFSDHILHGNSWEYKVKKFHNGVCRKVRCRHGVRDSTGQIHSKQSHYSQKQ